MRRKGLLYQLSASYLLISLVFLVFFSLIASNFIWESFIDKTQADLYSRAAIAREYFKDFLFDSSSMEIDVACKELGAGSATRITVIQDTGLVLCDSDHDILTMDNHADRPEVVQALESGRGMSVRYSSTLNTRVVYVAIPIMKEGKIFGVIRTAAPMERLAGRIRSFYVKVAVVGTGISLVGILMGLVVYRRFRRPLEVLKTAADRYARGDMAGKVMIDDAGDLGVVGQALDNMAEQLSEKIADTERRRSELESVLSSMMEGVIAVDNNVNKTPEMADRIIRAINVARRIERIGDLATNISEDVIYLNEGEIVRHRMKRGLKKDNRENDRDDDY